MSTTAKCLVGGKFLEDTLTDQYFAPFPNGTATITKAVFMNTTASIQTFSLYLVPISGTADDSNILIKDKSLQPDETYNANNLIGHIINAGGKISTVASAVDSINVRICGLEQT